MTLVWEHYPEGGSELLTALAYADHAHDDGTGIRPSVAYIARKTRQSERSVQRHLDCMRKKGWLLTVRYGDGGRGKATEYRINPLWITNPDKVTPFPQRVSGRAEKGDMGGRKRVTPMAPQPPRTVIEPTTTRDMRTGREVVGHAELKWPSLLDGSVRPSAEQVLQDCPVAERQNVLDEIAGLADRGAVRHPLGLLRKLVERAKQGQFVPAAALDYRRKLESQAIAVQTRIAEELRRQEQSTPQAREAALQAREAALAHLALLRQQLGDRPSRIKKKESP